MITIEDHFGIKVLRDDLLAGGTKSVLMDSIINPEAKEFVYASPVYGGFQIALSAYCAKIGKKATIFCAKRSEFHANTKKCLDYGAQIIEVPFGRLAVVEKKARDYAKETGAVKLIFGAKTEENKKIIAERMKSVIEIIGKEPSEIWCAVGSGTLVESILQGTKKAKIFGVQIGKEYTGKHKRLTLLPYHMNFHQIAKIEAPFPSTPNYDLKAWEYCLNYRKSKNVLFWNVL
jgi:cysteine synthase